MRIQLPESDNDRMDIITLRITRTDHQHMTPSKFNLYIVAIIFGLLGTVVGAFTGGFVAASRCDGGLECLGAAILGVGLGAIFMESAAMSWAVHKANRRHGNLPRTFVATLVLAIPIPFALVLGFTAVLAIPLFQLQVWACVKVEVASGLRKRDYRKK